MRALFTVIACAVVAGCVPMVSKYLRVEASGARYFRNTCHAAVGPPSVVYFPYHGIFISLDITDDVALGLHLPAGTVAQLNDTMVHILGVTDAGPTDAQVPIRAAKHGSLGTIDPPEFLGIRDPFSTPDYFGPLTGASESGRHIWYLFISETDREPIRILSTPRGLLRGTVELPSITINGKQYDPEVLQFERRAYGEISPINC